MKNIIINVIILLAGLAVSYVSVLGFVANGWIQVGDLSVTHNRLVVPLMIAIAAWVVVFPVSKFCWWLIGSFSHGAFELSFMGTIFMIFVGFPFIGQAAFMLAQFLLQPTSVVYIEGPRKDHVIIMGFVLMFIASITVIFFGNRDASKV